MALGAAAVVAPAVAVAQTVPAAAAAAVAVVAAVAAVAVAQSEHAAAATAVVAADAVAHTEAASLEVVEYTNNKGTPTILVRLNAFFEMMSYLRCQIFKRTYSYVKKSRVRSSRRVSTGKNHDPIMQTTSDGATGYDDNDDGGHDDGRQQQQQRW